MTRERGELTALACAQRERSLVRAREIQASIKEIGPLPAVANPERRRHAEESLLNWMMTYGGSEEAEECYYFTDPFCDEQLYMIEQVEQVLRHGGEVPLCIFRGGCKTTFCEWGILFACLTGLQRFALVVAASTGQANLIVNNIKIILQHNPLLLADYPEVCFPIARLENVTIRAKAQMLDGEPTRIHFGADYLQLPRVAGSQASGAIIMGKGADGQLRGLNVEGMRPTVVLIDDPQTNESAESLTQTQKRWDNIMSSMKGLAGHGVSLALLATVTVIKKDDLAERILAKWHGKRFGILRSMPKNLAAWEDYHEEYERTKAAISDPLQRAEIMKQYYLDRREVLDAGAEAAWESHYTAGEASAIQHAMNLYFFDKKAFWAEYMNQPMADEKLVDNLTMDDLVRKIRTDIPGGVVPAACTKVTAGIDVQKDCLYYLVTAWDDSFGGHVLEWGRFPKGLKKMSTYLPNTSLEEQIGTCIRDLGAQLQQATYRKDDGVEEMYISKVVLDANWGPYSQVIRNASKPFGRWMDPCFGWGKGPESRFLAKAKVFGEERGTEWHVPVLGKGEPCRTVTYNTNWWKSHVRNRILAGVLGQTSLTFPKGDTASHSKLFQHLLSERSSKLTGVYGTIDKWVLVPGQPNHWWDCLVMSAVGAAMTGVHLPAVKEKPGTPRTETVQKKGKKKWMTL